MSRLYFCRAASALAVNLLLCAPAWADYHIRSPYEIDLGEIELEHNGDATFDHLLDKSRAQSETLELGTGLTPRWHVEVEFGWERDPGPSQANRLTAVVAESMYQLTEPGAEWADWGVYAEYGQSTGHHGANEFTVGPVVGKDIGRFTTILNLFATRELGPDQSSHGLDISYAAQTRWRLAEVLSPALEVYGDIGSLTHTPRFNQQDFLAGPVVLGDMTLHSLRLPGAGKVKYELGYLFGATSATQQGTLRWRLELEIPF